MSKLTPEELEFIRIFFRKHSFDQPHRLYDIEIFMSIRRHRFHTAPLVQSLIEKNVFSLSPDSTSIKFTDYGLELVNAVGRSQQAWETLPIARAESTIRAQILVKAGETFRADRILRDIFAQAKQTLCIIDPYVGPKVFDLLEDSTFTGSARIITSTNTRSTTLHAYHAFSKQYANAQLRLLAGTIHDRFVLCDATHGFHFGHSLKDLGTKDTQINRIEDPGNHQALFEQRWTSAQIA